MQSLNFIDTIKTLSQIVRQFGDPTRVSHTNYQSHREDVDTVLSVTSNGEGENRIHIANRQSGEQGLGEDKDLNAVCHVIGMGESNNPRILQGKTYPESSSFSFWSKPGIKRRNTTD